MSMLIRFHEYGPPAVLRVEDETPAAPGPGEVLLGQHAVGVNYLDTLMRRGIYPSELPAIPGVEAAGVVESVGPSVERIRPGDRVAYYLVPGSYRAVRVVSEADLVPVPADVGFTEAAAVLTKGLTAWAALHGFHELQPGQTVLVQGASGAVGTLLARWATKLGASVIGTAGTKEKRALLEGSVTHVLPSDAPDLLPRIQDLAPGGVDVVYELVGRATFEVSQAAVRDGGTLVNIGAASGAPSVDAARLRSRSVSLRGGPMAQHLTGRLETAYKAVFDANRSGTFGRIQVTTLPLAEAATAHEMLEGRQRSGSTVLVP